MRLCTIVYVCIAYNMRLCTIVYVCMLIKTKKLDQQLYLIHSHNNR